MNHTVEEDGPLGPAAVLSSLFALRMIEGWAQTLPGKQDSAASSCVEWLVHSPWLGREFVAAGERLVALLRPQDRTTLWLRHKVMQTVCAPFGAWVAQHEAAYGRPPEPASRYWLQCNLDGLMRRHHSRCSDALPFVVPLTFPVRGQSYAEAAEAGAQLLAKAVERAGAAEARRYWTLSGMYPSQDDVHMVRAAIELVAGSFEEGRQWLERLGDSQFGKQDVDWKHGTMDGVVLSQGEFVPASAAEAVLPDGAGSSPVRERQLLPA